MIISLSISGWDEGKGRVTDHDRLSKNSSVKVDQNDSPVLRIVSNRIRPRLGFR